MSTVTLRANDSLAYRIWQPDDEATEPSGPMLTADSPLTQFNREFFLPTVLDLELEQIAALLDDRKTDDAGKAIDVDANGVSYCESVRWWAQLMKDPPLRLITDAMLVEFGKRLRKATYRRGLSGQERTLGEFTIAKHLKQVCAVLRCSGPRLDRRRAYAAILPEAPYMSIVTPELEEPKEPIEVDTATKIFAACGNMIAHGTTRRDFLRSLAAATAAACVALTKGNADEPPSRRNRGDGGEGSDDFWRAVVGTFFYTGFRYGTLRGVEWSMIEERREGHFFNCPGRIMKNGKPWLQYIRPELLQLYARLPRTSSLVFHWEHSETHFRDRHKHLQVNAGVKPRSVHAWRRAYADALDDTGANDVLRTTQGALGHKDSKTTTKFYTQHLPRFIRKLQWIFDGNVLHDPDQRTLF